MTSDDLEKHLRRLAIPVPSDSARERAKFHARTALSGAAGAAPHRRSISPMSFLLGASISAVVMLFLGPVRQQLSFAPASRSERPGAVENIAYEQRIFDEVQGVFPNNLRAIIDRGGAPEIVLADVPREEQSQPQVLCISRNGEKITIIGFSGDELAVKLSGTEEVLQLFVSGSGEVIVAGGDFAWSSGSSQSPRGYRISAAPLERKL